MPPPPDRCRTRPARRIGTDTAVSAVIAVILMVAITVVVSATVYVWASGMAQTGEAPEIASVLARGGDSDGDRAADHIRVLLVQGENAPYTYDGSERGIRLSVASTGGVFGIDDGALCLEVPAGGVCAAAFGDPGAPVPDLVWEPGQTLYLACANATPHTVTLTLAGGVNFEWVVECREATPP